MDMSMTFESWSTYSGEILFSSWDVTTKWEYILSWLAVVLFGIVFHGIRFVVVLVEDAMISLTTSKEKSPLLGNQLSPQESKSGDIEDSSYRNEATAYKFTDNPLLAAASVPGSSLSHRLFILRLFHAVFSGLNYSVALLMMLIAMTYNPGLFLALVFGYAVGDYFFFVRLKNISLDC